VTDNGLGGAFVCQNVWDVDAWALGAGGTLDYLYPPNQIHGCGDGTCNPIPGACLPNIDGGWWAVNCDPITGYLEFIAGYDFPCGIAGWAGQGCRLHKRAFFSGDALASCTLGDDLLHDPPAGNCGLDHCSTPAVGNITSAGGISLYTYTCAWGGGGDLHRGISTDGGNVVNTAAGQVDPWAGGALWHTRSGSEVMYWSPNVAALNLWYSTDNGSTWGIQGVLPAAVNDYKQALAMHHLNTLNMMYVNGATLRRSTDRGATWGVPTTQVAAAECVIPVMISDRPEGECFAVGCDVPAAGLWVFVTGDFGETWMNKTGNLDTWLTAGVDTIHQMIAIQSGGL